MTKSSVVKMEETKAYAKKKGVDESLLVMYFSAFDKLRTTIKQAAKDIGKRRMYRHRKATYDRSAFYIGRSITRISFYNVYVPAMKIVALSSLIQKMTDCTGMSFVLHKTDIHVYLRSKAKSE